MSEPKVFQKFPIVKKKKQAHITGVHADNLQASLFVTALTKVLHFLR